MAEHWAGSVRLACRAERGAACVLLIHQAVPCCSEFHWGSVLIGLFRGRGDGEVGFFI